MHSHKPPLWKQLLGAAVGGSVALSLYGIYTVAEPTVTAWLTVPKTTSDMPVRVAGVDEDRTAHIVSRAQQIAEEFGERPNHSVPVEEVVDIPPPPTPDPDIRASLFRPVEREFRVPPAPPVRVVQAATPEAIDPVHAGAPHLPQSGFGLGAVGIASLGLAAAWRKRKARSA